MRKRPTSNRSVVGRRVVYLFCEGETELGYLQRLQRLYNFSLVPILRVSAPSVLLESAVRWSILNASLLRRNPNLSVWVIFDYDGKEREIVECSKSLSSCPARKSDGVRCGHVFGACKAKDVIARIHVGFMSPCIELWGVMCTAEGARMSYCPIDRHELQRVLHRLMPRYSHKTVAQFDLERMTDVRSACSRAAYWSSTYGIFPACIHASHYAGIHPLITDILESGLRG